MALNQSGRELPQFFGIQKMVLFVWVCIVFMNLFMCSPRRSQLPSAERLCFVNVARCGQEPPEQIDFLYSFFFINLLLLKPNKAKGEKKNKKINMIQLEMWLPLWGNCIMKSSINPRVYICNIRDRCCNKSSLWILISEQVLNVTPETGNWLSLGAARRSSLSARHISTCKIQ